ncbi:MAG: polysaccharide biosynthesis protein [Butyrivibrio sp.]|nr:polysaccharide biosynthesis protein [Butyrivibrio sp.]
MATVSRKKRAAVNILFGYIGQLVTALASFALRKLFILRLSETLLGVNAVYTNILTLLSMAELGIGTALNFQLYGPVARGETETVKSYMRLYRRAYHLIAMVVAVLGLLVIPFLPVICKGADNLTRRELTLYYLIFLFNTVSTYFVSYKYSLAGAEQRNYIQTNIQSITRVITVAAQLVILFTTGSFLLFLLTDAGVQLISKIFVSFYLNHRYPCLTDREVAPLPAAVRQEVFTQTKALVLHRVGDMLRLQTDTVLISSMIQVTVAGRVDNYTLVVGTVSNFVNIAFNSLITSLGNLVATEGRKRQYEVFGVYRFCAAWIYGFASVGFLVLLTPLIRLWLGEAWLLPAAAVGLYLVDFYFKGERVVLSNFKTAAGVFSQDRYLSMLQGIVNLILSILLVQRIGLTGIYVGTVVSGLIANVTKPVIIYRACFAPAHTADTDWNGASAGSYFLDSVRFLIVTASVYGICYFLRQYVMPVPTIPSFLLMMVLITILFNGVFLLVFGRTTQAKYLWGVLGRVMKR